MKLTLLTLSILLGLSSSYPEEKVNYRKLFHHPKFPPRTKIINGRDAEPHAHPYQVYVSGNTPTMSHICGGSLIAPNIVLTAAHCLVDVIEVVMLLGIHNIEQPEPSGIMVVSTDFMSHEQYDKDVFDNDIAIIKLPHPVELNDYIKTVTIASDPSQTYANATANVTGWGNTSDDPNDLGASILQVLETRVMSNEECKSIPPFTSWILDTHLCTAGDKTTGTCLGDSGGPVVSNGVQIGVDSFNYKKCEMSKPSVHTRVSSYARWIKEKANFL